MRWLQDNYIYVLKLVPGGPAQLCGNIEVDDILYKVDNNSVSGMELDQVSQMGTNICIHARRFHTARPYNALHTCVRCNKRYPSVDNPPPPPHTHTHMRGIGLRPGTRPRRHTHYPRVRSGRRQVQNHALPQGC